MLIFEPSFTFEMIYMYAKFQVDTISLSEVIERTDKMLSYEAIVTIEAD